MFMQLHVPSSSSKLLSKHASVQLHVPSSKLLPNQYIMPLHAPGSSLTHAPGFVLPKYTPKPTLLAEYNPMESAWKEILWA